MGEECRQAAGASLPELNTESPIKGQTEAELRELLAPLVWAHSVVTQSAQHVCYITGLCLRRKKEFILYDGFEPSGRMHIAQGLFKAINVRSLRN